MFSSLVDQLILSMLFGDKTPDILVTLKTFGDSFLRVIRPVFVSLLTLWVLLGQPHVLALVHINKLSE
jgi:hypothetical protein